MSNHTTAKQSGGLLFFSTANALITGLVQYLTSRISKPHRTPNVKACLMNMRSLIILGKSFHFRIVKKIRVTYFMLLLRPPAMASLSEVLTSSRAFSLQKTMCLIPLQPLTQDYHELFSFVSFNFWSNNKEISGHLRMSSVGRSKG